MESGADPGHGGSAFLRKIRGRRVVVLDGVAKTADITAFRRSRFAEGQLIKAEFEYSDA